MKTSDLMRLLALASIWGFSFIFIRVLAPVLGPVMTAEGRVLIAGVALLAYMLAIGAPMEFRARWKQYLVLGVVNSAVPFLLYAIAAMSIPASYSAIFNSTAPLWAALLGVMLLGETLTPLLLVGLLSGICGVGLIAWVGPVELSTRVIVALCCCMAAAFCYAISGLYMKKFAKGINPLALATVSQLFAAVALAPAIPFFPVHGPIDTKIILCMLGLALACSGVAYVLYFRLLSDLGPTRALTVTYLVPLFGVVWSVIFLHERVTWTMGLGGALVLAAVVMVGKAMGAREAGRGSDGDFPELHEKADHAGVRAIRAGHDL